MIFFINFLFELFESQQLLSLNEPTIQISKAIKKLEKNYQTLVVSKIIESIKYF